MNDPLENQRILYNQTWQKGLQAGKEQRGNLQANIEFLQTTGLLKPGDKILEIGCGIGTIVQHFAQQAYDITGIDISTTAIKYGRRKYGPVNIHAQPAENLAFPDRTFDIVLSFDLFEHIAQIDTHIREVRRVLKNRGCYLFQTPNKYSNALFETLTKKSLKWRRAHPSLHSPAQLQKRLSRHGFETRFIKINTLNKFTLDKLRRNLGPLSGLFRCIDFTRLPLYLQTNLYVIACKLS